MNAAKRLQWTLLGLLGCGALLLVAMLTLQDAGTLTQARDLSERLDKADHERLEGLVSEKALQVMQPQAVLADGRRGEFLAGVMAAAENPGLRGWAQSSTLTKGRKPKAVVNPQAALDALPKGAWTSAVLVNVGGQVIASWSAAGRSELGTDLSKDPIFKQVSQPSWAPGIPGHGYVKTTLAATDTKAPAGKAPHTGALLVVGCGIDAGNGNFGGLLLVRAPVKAVLLDGDSSAFDALVKSAPNSVVMLARGNGDEIWHNAKDPFTENLASISADYKNLLAAMLKAPTGRMSVSSYDGQPGVMAWQRVGSVSDGDAPETVLSALAFVPQSAFGASSAVDKPKNWYLRWKVWCLFALALLVPYVLGLFFLPKALEPFHNTAEQARRVEEYSPIPNLVLGEEDDDDARALNRGMEVLARRAMQGEDRVRELDAALRRVEDQASKDATLSAQELSQAREKLAATDAGKQAAENKFEAAQKARQEADAQLANLRSALETATRNTELKASETRNLSTQVQDLMRALEEQRKVAEKAQESGKSKESEVVRLSAVNTLSSELKATLTVIKNYISTMLGSQGAISDAQQEFLGVVINKSARLERLIGDLVEISEIGSGVKPLRLESVSPSSLIQEALVNARPQAEHKKISLELAESGNLSPVQVDSEKVGAVLRSLLSQAIKVTARNEKIGLLVSERDSTVEIRVTDSGMSLPPDRSSKVFTAFHGVDSQAGPEFIGTGLRFPILKSVLEAHGGKIWIESQVGRGKTFVVALPKTGAPSTSSGQATSLPPPMASPPIAPAVRPATPLAGPPPLPTPLPAPVIKPVAPPPVVHKPAPLDDTLNSPWKRKESKDELEETMDLPALPTVKPASVVPSLPPPPPSLAAVVPGLPPLPGLEIKPAPAAVVIPPPVLTTDAKPTDADKADFDKVFGALPPQAEALKGGVPKVELKTGAKPNDADLASFAALFGGPATGAPTAPSIAAPPAVTPAAPPAPSASAAGGMADFDKIFGAPSGPPPAAPAIPAPPPPGLGVPPPPPPGVVPAIPGAADFDALFGAPAPRPSTPPPPPPSASSGQALNTMDDLNQMLGN